MARRKVEIEQRPAVSGKIRRFQRRTSKGQFVIEAVLLLVIGFSLLLGLKKWADSTGIFANIMVKPWARISGMVESGNWAEAGAARKYHPHNHEKVATLQQQ